ncbi:MAG TPA: polysaccharide pyruvyl transferase family protein [Candidatus Paceibacterota bacterium]|nr:polysaccharide pyruvyl transferase family protein [Candidatus Paceibacterota bacterium]
MPNNSVIIVRGNFSEGNFGDDALLLAVDQLLTHHYSCEQILFDCPQLAYRYDGVRCARIAVAADLRRASAILYGGGTQFFSFSESPRMMQLPLHRLIRAATSPKRLMERCRARYRLHLETGLPKIGVGLGFGPFVDNTSEEQAARVLARQMRFLWVRDVNSERFCRNNGAGNLTRASDLCFLSAFQQQYIHRRSASMKRVIPRVGIALRDWKFTGEGAMCITPYLQFAAMCRQRQIDVKFFVFSPKRDVEVTRQLIDANEEACHWTPDSISVMAFVEMLDACDVMVTSRFHAAVFSLLLGKPFVAVEIESKLKMVAELLGGWDVLVRLPVDPSCLFAKVKNIIDHLPEYCERARRTCFEQTQQADRARTEFDECMRTLG